MTGFHKVVIEIYGAKYPIKTPEYPEYVRELAGEIDQAVGRLMDSNRSMSLNEALVLTTLSYLDAYRKSEKGADHLRGQITEYLEDAAKARLEAGEARREITRLEKRLAAGAKENKA